MATKKVKTIEPPKLNILPQIPSAWSKEIKANGKAYEFTKNTPLPGFGRKPIIAGAKLHECNDGWFKLVEPGRQVGMRISPLLVKEKMESLKELV